MRVDVTVHPSRVTHNSPAFGQKGGHQVALAAAPIASPAAPEYLKVEEAAQLMRISRAKAYEMAQDGSLPGVVRIGRAVRVSRRRLIAWLEGDAAVA